MVWRAAYAAKSRFYSFEAFKNEREIGFCENGKMHVRAYLAGFDVAEIR
tara:strand:+ start:6862 stop:7008 length:147 start_codon:yes stop_codon:yes gene_type:complete